MSDVIVAPSVRDLDTLSAQLAAWMGARMPQAKEVKVSNLAYPFGAGQSHETILFDAAWTEGGRRVEQGMVVRIKPTSHTVYPDDLYEQQVKVMQVLREQGRVRVAKIFWYEPDPTLLGAPFFVMEKLRGKVAVSIPPYSQVGWLAESSPAHRAKVWENGVRQLAATQSTPLDSVPFLAGPANARDGLAQEWDKYVRFVEWDQKLYGAYPALEQALEGLQARWPKNQPAGIVWGDARMGNMMYDDGGNVLAVMDWEQPSLGGALHDLAWWVTIAGMMHGHEKFEGMGSRADTIALWGEVTGISTQDIEWYEDFTVLKICCLSIRTMALQGKPIPDNDSLARRLKLV